jgi:hypothetical protein
MEDTMKTLLFAATASLVVVACSRHENTPSTVTTTGAPGIVPNEEAVQRLTSAECERANVCNDIGAGRKYTDEGACRRENHHDLEADIRPTECPGGIRETKLSNCLSEIRNTKCGNVLQSIGRVAACRSGVMCVD